MTVSINFLFSPISVVVPFHVLDLCFVRQFLCDKSDCQRFIVLYWFLSVCRFSALLDNFFFMLAYE